MKNILIFLAVLIGLNAQAQYSTTLLTLNSTVCGTNTFGEGVIDVTSSTSVGFDVGFTGQSLAKTVALLGVTNAATNGQSLTLTLNGTATAYVFTNAPITNVAVLTMPAPIGTLTVTSATTNGQTFTVILNATTNAFTWTNAASASTDVATNTDIAASTTNLFNVLTLFYPTLTATYTDTNAIKLLALANSRLVVSASAGWGTAASNYVATVTNNVTTNGLQIATGASTAITTTNIYTKLTADYPDVTKGLTVTYSTASLLQIQTPFGDPFTLTASANWSTNSITTNSIGGGICFVCSNSQDRVTWYRYPALDFAMNYSSTAAVNYTTNFTGLGAIGYLTYSVSNNAVNYANPAGFRFKYFTKKGL